MSRTRRSAKAGRLDPLRLEDRVAPAVGTFFEDFSNDLDRVQPGWDTWDADPNTRPPGPDELFIYNNRTTLPLDATSGETRTGGQYAIRAMTTPYGPHVLTMYLDEVPNAKVTAFPSFLFNFYGPGSNIPGVVVPGGLSPGGVWPYEPAADEEVAVASAAVRGEGTVYFFGENTTIARHVGKQDAGGNYLWEHVSLNRDSVDDKGVRLGRIRQVGVSGVVRDGDGSSFDVNRIGVLVLQKQAPIPTNVIANDDYARVSQRQTVTQSVEFDWMRNDVDLDGDPLTLVGHTRPTHGEVEMRSSGFGTYRPAPGYLGRDSFEYTVTDGKGNTDTATVILDVVDNLPPVPDSRQIILPHGTTGPIRGTIDYRDPDGDPAVAAVRVERAPGDLTGAEGTFPRHGEVSFQVAGGQVSFEYRPVTGDLRGRDLVFFTLDDGRPGGVSETVQLELVAPNAPPAAADQRFEFAHGTRSPVSGSFSVADPDGDSIHSATLVGDGLYGDATVRVVGGRVEFEYVPHAGDLRGGDVFAYRVSDGYDDSAVARVEIVAPNTPPVATDIASGDPLWLERGYSILGPGDSTPVRGNILQKYTADEYAFVSDADDDTLRLIIDSGPRYGRLGWDPVTGEFTYTPIGRPLSGGGFDPLFGEDTFTYRVYDGHDASNLATVTIRQWLGQVQLRSDAFGIHYDAEPEDKILIIRATDLVANDRFERIDVAGHFDFVRISHFSGLRGPGALYKYDSGRDEVVYVTGDDVLLKPDEFLGYVPPSSGDERVFSFTYEVLYPPPGFPAAVSDSGLSSTTVLVIVTRHPQGDIDGRNGDGIHLQTNVASLPNSHDGKYVTLVAPPETPLVNVRAIPNPSPADAPPVPFPLGFLSFKVVGLEIAGATTITLLPPPGVVVNTYYKYHFGVGWYEFHWDGTTGAEFFDDDADGDTDRVVLHLKDNGRGDTDNIYDGVITDPGGPAFRSPPAVRVGYREYAAGADAGAGGVARLFNPDGSERFAALPFGDGHTGGVRTATADFNGDGVADLVVGTGPGRSTRVVVLDGATQAELFALDPFEPGFTGGVYVAAGDLTGDGVADLVVTPDEGGGPRVRVFRGGDFAQVADFFGIEDPAFRGGARAAVGDVNRDGVADLLVAAGFGGGPRLAVFDGRSVAAGLPARLFGDFFMFEPTLRNGVFVAAGDLDGDGAADAIAGGGPGGGPRVFALSGRDLMAGTQTQLANFFAGDVAGRGGVRVGVKDLDGDARADLVVGSGSGGGSRVTTYLGTTIPADGAPPEAFAFDAFPGFTGGVFVG